MNEESIFAEAIAKPSDERPAFLDRMCGDDAQLRSRVDALLAAHDKPDDFLDDPVGEVDATIDHAPILECAGATIGPYILREQVGEGGMGVVFVAEQQRPVRRKVALKIIKPGMDTKEVVARFEAERQALALMDHPNIAKVYDAASTESGRPYFVMELVRGIPITDYCDKHRLTIRERLVLFIDVCQAIQHAHQKGVIHRDVKPSNVLVTLHDGKPIPKIIDFGVAKATNQRLTERTIYTQFAQIIGTPLYMSPEQAEMSGLDVDTRCDIYSLGVVLYELLTGSTPFDKARMHEVALQEMRRIVCEEEPPRPSTRISTLGGSATDISMRRGTDPRGLSKFMTGDLDVIVMKAIEKDRTRRYGTAAGMADDLQRFLNNEPVVARPPSMAYRLSKFAKRNRLTVVTSALVLALLLVTATLTSWMAIRERAMSARLSRAYYQEAVTAALSGDFQKAHSAVDLLEDPYQVAVLSGTIAYNRGIYEDAVEFADQALKIRSQDSTAGDVAARSLRVAASIYAGQEDYAIMHGGELLELKPSDDVDHLLMAIALLLAYPERTLRLIESSPSVQYSAIGILIRGRARVELANDRHDVELMEQAIRDMEYAAFLFRDSPAPLAWYGTAIAEYIEMSKQVQEDKDMTSYRESAREVVAKLPASGEFPHGDFVRWLFLRAIGGHDEQASAAVCRLGKTPGFALFVAADCLRREDPIEASREFKRCVPSVYWDDKWVRIARAHLARDLPDGEQRVRELAADLVKDSSAFLVRHALNVLCLAATPDEIRQLATSVPDSVFDGDDAEGLWNASLCFKLLAGTEAEANVLEDAGDGQYALSLTHFTIGMLRLADGKREEAFEHFKACVETTAIGSFDYELGRAYFERMQADPSWPHWLVGGQ